MSAQPVIYLHGFASSPQSSKARFFAERFASLGVPFVAPQLDEGNFQGLTITGQLRVVHETVKSALTGEHGTCDPKVVMMGSSLGGYLAGLYAARHPQAVEKLVLLAPAFQFPSRWKQRFTPAQLRHWQTHGSLPFYHYGHKEERHLGYQIVDDALRYEDEPPFSQPALILHGIHDDTVPYEVSQRFVIHRPNARVRTFESGHELTDVLDGLWYETKTFLGYQIP